mmetsp:Transcript_26739/g.49212  ORF Transcript_26739/g.49212 Transcript_26739/m.49212 type:complete len:83 (+) Transcript_26739:191-439(+)
MPDLQLALDFMLVPDFRLLVFAKGLPSKVDLLFVIDGVLEFTELLLALSCTRHTNFDGLRWLDRLTLVPTCQEPSCSNGKSG